MSKLIVTADQPSVALALCKALRYVPNAHIFVGIHDNTPDLDLAGGFIIDRFTGRGGSCYLHYAGFRDGWFSRRVILWLARYIWVTNQCRAVYGEVRASDLYVRELDERLGFRQIAYLPGFYPNDDAVLYELRREDCKWLKLLERRGTE